MWQANTYTVTYKGNGSTSGTTANSSHTYNTAKALTSNGYARTGYTFKGWSTSSTATSATYTNAQSVKNLTSTNGATVTLYAVWQVNTYTVVYNANGGTGTTANSSHTYGTAKALTNNGYSRTGYTFKGWSTSSTATSATYTNGQSVTNLTATNGATVTLYAVWQAHTYTVVYNGNGATSGTTANSSHTYNTAKALTANGFTRTGYKFKGWSTSSTATTATYTNTQSVSNLTSTNGATVTLYAVWECVVFYIQYNANGGAGTMANSMHEIADPGLISTCTFTKTGFVFYGWSTNQNATMGNYMNNTEIPVLAAAGETIVMYAIWLKNDITITIDPNGGLFNGVETETEINITFQEDLTIEQPTRQGHAFLEFNTSSDGQGQSLTSTMTLSSDVTFYAIWEPLNYYIKYYDGDLYLGETVAMYNETLSLTSWATLLQNNSLTGGKFAQYGWNFAGWTSNQNGTQIQYSNSAGVNNITEAGTTLNLYAIHTQPLVITYNGNGATSGEVANQSCDLMLNSLTENIADFVVTLSTNSFAKTNYSFTNWAIDSTSGEQYSAGANITNTNLNLTYSSTFSKTFYAIWQGNSYTINYYNSTTQIASVNYVYGTTAALTEFDLVASVMHYAYGWEFYGWATENNTFTRVFEDAEDITNISMADGSEITPNRVINLYAVYERLVEFISGENKANATYATQYWNPYSTANTNLSTVLAEIPQAIVEGGWTALGYRVDLNATAPTFEVTSTTEIRPEVNKFNTLYAIYIRTITDTEGSTTAIQYYNSVGTISTVNA